MHKYVVFSYKVSKLLSIQKSISMILYTPNANNSPLNNTMRIPLENESAIVAINTNQLQRLTQTIQHQLPLSSPSFMHGHDLMDFLNGLVKCPSSISRLFV